MASAEPVPDSGFEEDDRHGEPEPSASKEQADVESRENGRNSKERYACPGRVAVELILAWVLVPPALFLQT